MDSKHHTLESLLRNCKAFDTALIRLVNPLQILRVELLHIYCDRCNTVTFPQQETAYNDISIIVNVDY